MSQMGIPTNVINKWPYYEFEEYIKLLNKKNEEEKKRHESEDKNQKQNMPNLGNMTSGLNPANFKMPNISNPFGR